MSRSPLLLLLASTLVIAGCVTPGTATDPAPAPAAGGASPSAAASLSADPRNATVDDTPRPLVIVPFSWDGKLSRFVCAPSGPNSCRGLPVPLGSGDSFEDTGEAPVDVALIVTWTAETPLTQELWAQLVAAMPCGEGCHSFRSIHNATGPSPLSVTAQDLALDANETVGIYLTTKTSPCAREAVVMACARLVEQPFHVEGALTVPVAPEG